MLEREKAPSWCWTVSSQAVVLGLLVVGAYLATQSMRCSHSTQDVVRLAKEVDSMQERLDVLRSSSTTPAPLALVVATTTSVPVVVVARKVEPSPLRLVSFNILEGAPNGRMEKIAAWLDTVDPDVVGLLECNGGSEEWLKKHAREWGHEHAVFGVASSGYHVALTSRWPMEDVQVDTTHFRHACVSARIRDLRVMVVHLRPETGDLRLAEVRHLPLGSGPNASPLVLMGDLNSLSSLDDDAYEKTELEHIFDSAAAGDAKDVKLLKKFTVAGKLDYRVLDELYRDNLTDLVHSTSNTSYTVVVSKGPASSVVFSPTVPTVLHQDLDFMNNDHSMRLDYMLGRHVAVAGFCDTVREAATEQLSDHLPVMCVVRIDK
jgi:exodeoxyribonuclease-3